MNKGENAIKNRKGTKLDSWFDDSYLISYVYMQ